MTQSFSHFNPPHKADSNIIYGDRPSKWWLFWNKQKKRVHSLFIIPLIAVLAVGSGWATIALLPNQTKTYLFNNIAKINPFIVKKIQIDGNALTDQNSVYLSLGVALGDPFFDFSIEDARKNILDLPFVEECTIERLWPNTILIHLTERKPIAIWQNKGHFVLINIKGETISSHDITVEKEGHIFAKLPLVVGEDANKAAASLLANIEHYPILKEKIAAFIRIGQRRWNLILKNKTLIMLPEGAEDSALAHLQSYQDMFQLLDRPIPSIDMRLPDRMVIHLEPSLQAQTPISEHTAKNTSSSPPITHH